MTAQLTRHLFTVDEYFRMGETGVLTEDDRIELIEGEIVDMPPIGSHHSGTVNALLALFNPAVGSKAVVSPQNPIRLNEQSAPQPDLAVLRPRADYYRESHPEPDDVLLLIEVGDSTIASDREIKAPLYAAAGIPELWIVDVAAGHVEVYRAPLSGQYTSFEVTERSERIAPLALPGLTIAVDDILG